MASKDSARLASDAAPDPPIHPFWNTWIAGPPGRLFHSVTLVICIPICASAVYGCVGFVALLAIGMLLLMAAIWFIRLIACVVCFSRYRDALPIADSKWRWLIGPLIILVICGLAFSGLPYRIALQIARHDLDELARQARSGDRVYQTGRFVGLWYCPLVTVQDGMALVCLSRWPVLHHTPALGFSESGFEVPVLSSEDSGVDLVTLYAMRFPILNGCDVCSSRELGIGEGWFRLSLHGFPSRRTAASQPASEIGR